VATITFTNIEIMPWNHFLPAGYLASFSSDKITLPRRKRILYVGDLKNCHHFKAPASRIGASWNLYSDTTDQVWSQYESALPQSIEKLTNGTIDAETWARVLVPFVACLFVRNHDFNQRFEKRLPFHRMQKFISNRNTDNARLFELQRLLTPVLSAAWTVIRTFENEEIITSDLGYGYMQDIRNNVIICTIPLNNNHILQITPRRKGIILELANDKWVPKINYVEVIKGNGHHLNTGIHTLAQRFVFGSNQETIERYCYRPHNLITPPEPGLAGFIYGRLAVVHEFTWHRLISFLNCNSLNPEPRMFDLNPTAYMKGWYPKIFLPTNLPLFPNPFNIINNEIEVELYDVAGFTDE